MNAENIGLKDGNGTTGRERQMKKIKPDKRFKVCSMISDKQILAFIKRRIEK